ncbi:pppGpp synthetase, RelA/SpoT family [Legionella oakridgensis ATCC 33761 = DSM 21215]|uniref:GTP pyrophosphokinase n=3 Tax=Legionella oakridgensis TaxID=29423 RepID=W0B9W5_9GAMM|nr:pppGpp synthetase, RelA/SpoT family [Legionella oakridgensis ATCC 33761 = DSM 21215]ETO93060.1 (p)ppGpp synthetase, RelA/SpoT family [Legionella oakridgensis RV-2-2007]KTD37904.1 GTP pyrophosphokinase [Legionella oakridgensis]STY20374.1 GTP pyrophosphokinase [Legionella longbeachae]
MLNPLLCLKKHEIKDKKEVMVKVKENIPVLSDGSIDVEQWLHQISSKGYFQELELIRNACTLSQLAGHDQATETGESSFQRGLAMADVLADLEVDRETLAAALVYESVHYAELSVDVVEEQLGSNIARLVKGIEKMNAISSLQALNRYPQSKHQVDNVRKMLLAMVDDVRVVLIKLAEQLCILRASSPLPESMRRHIATESMEIYAPLANRLGIGAIKWEMEDLAFRHLYPDDYKAIAKGLKAKRLERDRFVNFIVEELNQQIANLGFHHFAVYGRSKHIHSIYRKMQRKNVSLDEIYDATAVRILVETREQCYEVLGLVHSLWPQVVAEFDDYIVNPKPNGYQSLHTAVRGPEDKVFEVQIRTFEMHDLAEMGVAAHWKYKEGGTEKKESHERKIEWLREVLAWHREMASNHGISEAIEREFLEDRVYVFTPDGDVLDLPQGVTPLDFAYQVHSEIGHRCRGAKVNGHIVPLTYVLKTGDKVEVLTGKDARPSRDWINPHLNYLKTPRAKAKVLHWFRMQDFDRNKADGHEILDKELKALGLKTDRLQEVAFAFNLKTLDDLYATLGRGDIKLGQILNRLTPVETIEETVQNIVKPQTQPGISGSDLRIEGVGNLLTHMARCCQPVPGDEVIGYITLGRGVSVHRKDCPNIIHAGEKQRQRFLQVSWGSNTREQYVVDILIKAFDRTGLLKDVTSLLANEKAHVYALQTQTNKQDNMSYITLKVEIDGLNSLSRLLNKLDQIPNVLEARRQV